MLPVRVWRYGKDEDPPRRSPLRAGPLSLWREEGDICAITLGDREVIHRVFVVVRDRNWTTVKPVYSHIQEDAGKDSFRISFDVENQEGAIRFSWRGVITGAPDGTIRFSMDGAARSTFLRNRIGFCVLHPDSCAGASCRITHPDGTAEALTFPRRISPHQPFLDLKSIGHEVVPGTWADVAFEGDVFETEDQRNWTDASYKTYCTPLSLPFPAEVKAGTRVLQSVTISLSRQDGPGGALGKPAGVAAADPRITYAIDAGKGVKPLPRVGLCIASHGGVLSTAQLALLCALRPDHLRVDLELSRPGAAEALGKAAAEAAALGAKLEIAVFLSDAADRELAWLRAQMGSLPCGVARWLVFRTGEPCTTEKWVAAARQALAGSAPAAQFASGTNAYFTELNRGAPPGPSTDALVYSINPQIHAFDNTSVMETLSAQPATVESARAIGGGRPIVISPMTLKPRFNAVATGPIPPVPPGELPPQVDPRQMSLFAAAWTLGSISRLAGSGVASATYFETTGWRGVMETDEGASVPARFPSIPSAVFPVYHVFADIAERKDGVVLAGGSSAPLVVDGLAIRSSAGIRTVLANLTATPTAITVEAAEAVRRPARVRILDESSAEGACRAPARFRAEAGKQASWRNGRLELDLLTYAVACIDWEE